MDERFWPYPLAKPASEWDEFDRDYIDFLQLAFQEGFRPREASYSKVSLGNYPEGRSVSLLRRGNLNGWEPVLCDDQNEVRLDPEFNLPPGRPAIVCVRPPFRAAAFLALEWMRGRRLESLLTDFEFVGGFPAGIVIKPGILRETD